MKQIAMSINLNLQCLKGGEGILVAGMGSASLTGEFLRQCWQEEEVGILVFLARKVLFPSSKL